MSVTNRAMRLLESLTPGGSEFYNDPERCLDFIFKQIQDLRKMVKRKLTLITTDRDTWPEENREVLLRGYDGSMVARIQHTGHQHTWVSKALDCKFGGRPIDFDSDKWMYLPEDI